MAHKSVANKWNWHGEVDNIKYDRLINPQKKRRGKKNNSHSAVTVTKKGLAETNDNNNKQQQQANIVIKLIAVLVWIMRSIYAWLIG